MRKLILTTLTILASLAIPAAAQAGSNFVSGNWSGYFALAGPGYRVNTVTTQFTVPPANCKETKGKTQTSIFATGGNGTFIWAGIDGAGFGGDYVEQGGIAMFCDKDSVAHYSGFWEMVSPDKPTSGPHELPAVYPGDEVHVSVYRAVKFLGGPLGYYIIDVADAGVHGLRWSESVPSALNADAPNASAETIIEKPIGATHLTVYAGLVKTRSYATVTRDGNGTLVPYYADTPYSTAHRASIHEGTSHATPSRATEDKQASQFGWSIFSEGITGS